MMPGLGDILKDPKKAQRRANDLLTALENATKAIEVNTKINKEQIKEMKQLREEMEKTRRGK